MSKQTKSATEIGSNDEDSDFKAVGPMCTTHGDNLRFYQYNKYAHYLSISSSHDRTPQLIFASCSFFESKEFPITSFHFLALDGLQRPSGRCKTLARQHFSQSWLNHCRLHVTLVRCENRSSTFGHKDTRGTCGSVANLLSCFLLRSDLGSWVW